MICRTAIGTKSIYHGRVHRSVIKNNFSFNFFFPQNPEFLNTFSPSFVGLKVNGVHTTPQPPSEAEQAARLRLACGIASYPSLLVLAADGTELTRIDTRKDRPASSPADYSIQAIDEVRLATRDGLPVKSSWWPF